MTVRPRDLAALVLVGVVAVVAGFYVLALKPEHQRAAKLNGEIATARQSLATEITKLQTGLAAKQSLTAQDSQAAALARALPQSSDIPALLRLLQGNAHAVGVQMQSIQLQGSSTGTAAPTTPSTTTTTTTAAGSATSVPVTMTFTGGYNDLDKLVRRLDHLVVLSRTNKVTATGPLMTVSGVQITPGKPLTVQLTATIYQLSALTSAAASQGSS